MFYLYIFKKKSMNKQKYIYVVGSFMDDPVDDWISSSMNNMLHRIAVSRVVVRFVIQLTVRFPMNKETKCINEKKNVIMDYY